jgi:hypothetical protein
MDFRRAATILGRQITTSDLAKSLKMSAHSIRQARLIDGAPGFRKAPDGWKAAIVSLANQRIVELQELVDELERVDVTEQTDSASRSLTYVRR